MKKKDAIDQYITMKEIILGLRAEYQKNEMELQKLKSFCTSKKKIESFHFSIYNMDEEKTLACYYKKRKNQIQEMIEEIRNSIFSLDLTRNFGYLEKNSHNHYVLKGTHSNYPVSIKKTHQYAFDEQVSKILNSQFVNNSEKTIFHNGIIEFDYGSIRIFNNSLFIGLNYQAANDRITLTSDIPLSREKMEATLNAEVPTSVLSPYQMQTISTSPIMEKEIILDDFKIDPYVMTKLKIEEEDEKIVLTKENFYNGNRK